MSVAIGDPAPDFTLAGTDNSGGERGTTTSPTSVGAR